MARTAGGGTCAAEARGPGGAAYVRPALHAGLAALSAAAVGLALVAGVRAGAGALRETELLRAVGAGRAVASALETYDVEHGAFPPPVASGARLAAELQDSLGQPAVLARAAAPFSYVPGPDGYTLAFTPAPGALPVRLVVTAGRGGVLTAAGSSVAVGW